MHMQGIIAFPSTPPDLSAAAWAFPCWNGSRTDGRVPFSSPPSANRNGSRWGFSDRDGSSLIRRSHRCRYCTPDLQCLLETFVPDPPPRFLLRPGPVRCFSISGLVPPLFSLSPCCSCSLPCPAELPFHTTQTLQQVADPLSLAYREPPAQRTTTPHHPERRHADLRSTSVEV